MNCLFVYVPSYHLTAFADLKKASRGVEFIEESDFCWPDAGLSGIQNQTGKLNQGDHGPPNNQE